MYELYGGCKGSGMFFFVKNSPSDNEVRLRSLDAKRKSWQWVVQGNPFCINIPGAIKSLIHCLDLEYEFFVGNFTTIKKDNKLGIDCRFEHASFLRPR